MFAVISTMDASMTHNWVFLYPWPNGMQMFWVFASLMPWQSMFLQAAIAYRISCVLFLFALSASSIYVCPLSSISIEHHSPRLYFQAFHFNHMSQGSIDTYSSLTDSTTSIATLIDTIVNLPSNPPSLHLDLEGVNLSRHGSLSRSYSLQLHPQKHLYLIDNHFPGPTVFRTPRRGGTTLKSIPRVIEHPPNLLRRPERLRRPLFPLRHCLARSTGYIQLMECASRAGPSKKREKKKNVYGLRKCIESDAPLSTRSRSRHGAPPGRLVRCSLLRRERRVVCRLH